MDQGLKERLVGAAVLIAIAVWLVPWVLDGPETPLESGGSSLQLPAAEEPMPMRTQTLRLGDDAEQAPTAAATPPPAAAPGACGDRRAAPWSMTPRPWPRTQPAKRLLSPQSARAATRARGPGCCRACAGRDSAKAGTGCRSRRRLDGPARQLRRGGQRSSRRAARRDVRSQGRGLAGPQQRAHVVPRARHAGALEGRGRRGRIGAQGSRHRRRSRGVGALSWNDAGRLRHLVFGSRFGSGWCVAGFTSEALSLITLLAAIGLAWTFAGQLGAEPRQLGVRGRSPALGGAIHYFCVRARDRWSHLLACEKIDSSFGLERRSIGFSARDSGCCVRQYSSAWP